MPPRTSCRHPFPALLIASFLLAACGGGPTDTKVPGAITVSPTNVALDAVGQTQQLSATVTDQDGAPISSPSVSWSTSNASVAIVSGTGLVSATGPGTAQITATAGSVNASAAVTVMQTPTQILKVAGDGQAANIGQAAATPLTVQVNDANGHPVSGVTVGFTVAAELGTLGSPTGVTGADGRVATSFTFVGSGPIPVTAAVAGTALTVTFTETGISPFAIQIRYLTASPSRAPTAAQQQAFEFARRRWEGLIVGDVVDLHLTIAADDCFPGTPAVNEDIDDVIIFVILEPIDGAGNVLAASGPCFIRNPAGATDPAIPILGVMKFDTSDLDNLTADQLELVVTHEMGHVLGFGTIWDNLNLLADASLPPTNGTDPHFTGSQAIAAFNSVGGAGYNASAKIPVENTGGVGTADSHWRESVFVNELMTGFLDAGVNPLSEVTVASMADLGYDVNAAGAEPYTLPSPALKAFAGGKRVQLKNDLLSIPIRAVDESGRVVRIITP